MRLLIAEDEKSLNQTLSERLTKAGYSVDSCFDGEDALYYIESAQYDGIILDVMMPKINGFEVLRTIRNKKILTPVLMLTAKDSDEDIIKGLDSGANDYLTKPFSFAVLSARIRAMLRVKENITASVMEIADLSVDTTTRQVKRGDTIVELSSKEYAILEYLMRKKSTPLDMLKKLGLVVATFVASVAVTIIFPMIGSFMTPYILLGIAGVIYGAVVLLRNFSLEYEYIFTNGDLDVDIVKAQHSRKRMTSLKCKNIEVMASDKNMEFKREFENESISKKFNAVFDAAAGGIYHVLFVNDGEKLLLTFQPPAKLLTAMKNYNPRCVHVDPEDVVED